MCCLFLQQTAFFTMDFPNIFPKSIRKIRGIPVKKAPPFKGRLEQRGGAFLQRILVIGPPQAKKNEVFHQFSVQKSCKKGVFERLGRRRRQNFSPAALKTSKNLLKNVIFG